MSDPIKSRTAPLVERYASGGAILTYATAGLTEDHGRAAPGTGAGAWTVAELLAHLVDVELVFADRMKWVLAENDPPLPSFDENRWAARLEYGISPVAEAVSLIALNRTWMGRILRNGSETDFARTGAHSELGKVTLAEMLARVTNHLDHHLRFLYLKRANLGVAVPPRYGAEQLGRAVHG